MADGTIQIGMVGTGRNAKLRRVPGFRAMEGVEIVSVCNSSRESSERAAKELGIPKVYDNWLELVQAPDTNAVCIGTWSNLHLPITLAALENDKHVLCEARMALNAREARAMLDASRSKPHLVAQIMPSSVTYPIDNLIVEMIQSGYLGELLAVDMHLSEFRSHDTRTRSDFINYDAPMGTGHGQETSGYNVLNLGVWYESMMRWIGPATRVMASSNVFVNKRRAQDGSRRVVSSPDHVNVICDLACGAQARMTFSVVCGLAPTCQVWLFGSEGTLRIEAPPLKVFGGKRGDTEMKEMPNPEEKRRKLLVEEEFIRAIRGEMKVARIPLEVGVQYMEFSEAVARSAQTGQAVSLPL